MISTSSWTSKSFPNNKLLKVNKKLFNFELMSVMKSGWSSFVNNNNVSWMVGLLNIQKYRSVKHEKTVLTNCWSSFADVLHSANNMNRIIEQSFTQQNIENIAASDTSSLSNSVDFKNICEQCEIVCNKQSRKLQFNIKILWSAFSSFNIILKPFKSLWDYIQHQSLPAYRYTVV